MKRHMMSIAILFGLIGLVILPAAAQQPVITAANGTQITDLGVIAEDWLSHVVWSPDNETLALPQVGGGGMTRFVTMSAPESFGLFEAPLGDSGSLAFSPDGEFMAMIMSSSPGADATSLYLFYRSFAERSHADGYFGIVPSMAFHPNGKILALAYESSIHLWNLNNPETTVITPDPVNLPQVLSVAFSDNGSYMVTATDNGVVQVWDAASMTKRFRITGVEPLAQPESASAPGDVPVISAVFSPDNDSLAIALKSLHTMAIIPITDDMPVTLEIDPNESAPGNATYLRGCGTTPVSFNRGGDLLASGDQNGSVCVWDVSRAELAAELTGHTDEVLSVGFSRDGRRLASSSRDSTVRLWRINN